MTYHTGDRIRLVLTGDDGLPLVRYGFVGNLIGPDGPIVVMLDGELSPELVELTDVMPVEVTTVELLLFGRDLIDDPELRRGLVGMWQAEADQAGLAVDALHPMGSGLRDSSDGWALAELMAGGEQYVVRASTCPNDPGTIRVRADRPNRWEW